MKHRNCFIFIIACSFLSLPVTAQSITDFTNFSTTNTGAFTTNNFKAVGVGKNGHVWAGTQYGGLYKYNPTLNSWEKSTELTNVFINDIKTDKDGGIWIAQSGQSAVVGGGSNIAGGINYFPTSAFGGMNFYSVTPGGGLTSRNVRSLWIDTSRTNGASNLPRVWAAQASFTTSFNATRGGVGTGLSATPDYFFKVKNGLDQSGLSSPLSVGGNENEVWVMVQNNFGKSQILRYHSSSVTGLFKGAMDNTNTNGALSAGFRANVIYFDNSGYQWIGQQNGGVIVKMNALWVTLYNNSVFPAGVTINNNAITGDEEGNVYIGTSSGLVVFSGGDPRDEVNYRLYTTTDGLPSNNVTGIAVDTFNKRIILATANGVSFWKTNKKIQVKLGWDYSFPQLAITPKGVAADGVSRLYVKVKRGSDTLPQIDEVTISLKDYHTVDKSIRGRLNYARKLTEYTNEAAIEPQVEITRRDRSTDGTFWFWYLSPEDFSIDNVGGNAQKSERRDILKVKVTFADGTKDSTNFDVMVVRPPTLFVHGLASGPPAFDGMVHNHTVKLVESPLFKYSRALVMDGKGRFMKNANRLLHFDPLDPDSRSNSLQGNIERMRKMGYAANQVDYICHSMGGLMIRGAIGWYSDKFFANGAYPYNNYGKGFVHKLIFNNTPHNSSPIADGVFEFLPKADFTANYFLSRWFALDPGSQIPFDFFQPDKHLTTLADFPIYSFTASDAVRDLQVSNARGGVNMPYTPRVKNHLIVGDINLNASSLSGLVDQKVLALTKQMGGYTLLRIARDYAGVDKAYITSLLDPVITESEAFFKFFNSYGAKKNFPNFAGDGDLIVPLMSETAQQTGRPPHITYYENGIGEVDAMHTSIMGRPDVGERIVELLNSPLNNNALFADDIAANNDAEPQYRLANSFRTNAAVSVTNYFDTSKIVITAPARGNITAYADSILSIHISLKDTVGLAYININFQNNDSFRLVRNAVHHFNWEVNGLYTGNQMIMATAVYDKGDSVKYYTDSMGVKIINLGVLQGFRIQQEEADITGKIGYKPLYETRYNSLWRSLSSGDTSIKISFFPDGIALYDTASRTIKAVQSGYTQAYFTYKGFKDTVGINASLELPTQNLVFSGKLFLQGAYNTSTGSMNTTLNNSGLLQANAAEQPYSQNGFTYFGEERVSESFFATNPAIVDWVLVELRDSAKPTAIVSSRAAFVRNDGSLVDTNGTSPNIVFPDLKAANYYVVIKHRNHLPVRSSALIDFTAGSGSYDFTTSMNQAFAGSVTNTPMVSFGNGVYGLWGGNAATDDIIKMTGLQADGNDYLKLLKTLGNVNAVQNNIYSPQDINMDGKVNMTGSDNDLSKLLQILGNSINQIFKPAF